MVTIERMIKIIPGNNTPHKRMAQQKIVLPYERDYSFAGSQHFRGGPFPGRFYMEY